MLRVIYGELRLICSNGFSAICEPIQQAWVDVADLFPGCYVGVT